MSIQLTVYIGPYLTVPKSVDWTQWDDIVFDGRMEAESGDELILVPNRELDGITRQMDFDRHSEQDVTQITPDAIVREIAAFALLTRHLVAFLGESGIDVRTAWGVVPRWS